MRKYIFLTLIIVVYSCKTGGYKKRLIGEWYLLENPSICLQFTKDSLFLNSYPLKTTQVWSVDKSNIYLYEVSNIRLNQLDDLWLRNQFYYLLSKNKDTLYWQSNRKTDSVSYKLIRIKNKYDYFQKTIGLNIDLPISKANLIPILDDKVSLNYFIGFKNDTLRVKNNIQFITLKDILFDYFKFKYKHNSDVVINLFADKNVSTSQMDSINIFLKNKGINRIFRVYRNDIYSYENNLNWHGLYQ